MKKALIYCRVSTEEQTKGGHHSLSAQRNICYKFAKDKEFRIAKVYEDAGKSASNTNRPELQDMLIRCEKDESIDYILVQDTDRLARNVNDHSAIKALLEKYKVTLISVSQPIIDQSAEGNMIDNIIASVNQYQLDLTKRKTRKGLEEKVRKGGWPRLAPVGYKNVSDKLGNKTVEIDPVKGPLVIEAYKMYATGNYSAMKVAKKLYPKGLTSQKGKMLANSKIIDLLKNRFLIGEINWSGIRTSGTHQPLIDEQTYNQVQAIMADHNHHVSRAYKHSYLLSGYLHCSVCGSGFTGETHVAKNKKYYRCSRKIDHYGEHTQTHELEKQVLDRFQEVQFSPCFINKVIFNVKKLFKEKRKDIDKQKKVLYAKKKSLETKRDVAEEKLFNGVISDEDFGRNKNKLRAELEAVQDKIDELDQIRDIKVDVIQEVLKLTRDVQTAYRQASDELKRQYLHLFWEKFEVKERRIVQAVPTRIFKALQNDYKASIKAHKPVLSERASVPWGDCHPIRQLSNREKVQTTSEWGG